MRTLGLVAGILSAVLIGVVMGCAWPPSADALQAGRPADSERTEAVIEGRVAAVTSSIRQTADGSIEPPSVSLLLRSDGTLITVIVAEGAEVLAADGQIIEPNEIPLSARVRAEGRQLSQTQFEATSVDVLP